jgi:DNA-binding response OmpR family regulator
MVLDAGADHCFGETGGSEGRLVLSALSAVWRRRERDLEERSRIVEAGHLRIDRERRVATLGGSPLALTATEFDIVTLLTERAGELLSASEILRAVHGQDYEPAEARDIVKVHMSRLRQKLEADPVASRCIVNVRGQGYKYVFDRRHAHGTGAVPQLATV